MLLLDEVTVDLDVVVRARLMKFLKSETEKGATVVYATHIFDGVAGWPTTVIHLDGGELTKVRMIPSFSNFSTNGSTTGLTALKDASSDPFLKELSTTFPELHQVVVHRLAPDSVSTSSILASSSDTHPYLHNSCLQSVIEAWLLDSLYSDGTRREEKKTNTCWDELNDMRKYGDKFYDYWNGRE